MPALELPPLHRLKLFKRARDALQAHMPRVWSIEKQGGRDGYRVKERYGVKEEGSRCVGGREQASIREDTEGAGRRK